MTKMQPPHPRLTIKTLMIAIVLVAALLVVARDHAFFLVPPLYLSLAASIWQLFRNFRRLSALAFGIMATVSNIACIVIELLFQGFASDFFGIGCCVLTFPIAFGTGSAWATAAIRHRKTHPRSAVWAPPIVVVLSFLPITTTLTHWPFRLAFLASQSALERMADQALTTDPPLVPARAGMFRVLASSVTPSGNVALLTDLDPTGRSGFVRRTLGPDGIRNEHGPLYNLNHDVALTAEWSYECED